MMVYVKGTMLGTCGLRRRGLLLCSIWLLLVCVSCLGCGAHGLGSSDVPVLRVGEEKKGESLSFYDGSSREYEVRGLQDRKWYEIKISYPASIPASFEISLVHKSSPDMPRSGRRLLNTEKMMFYVTKDFPQQAATAEYWKRVIVVVHPAAVLSKQHTSNQPFILYNIMCEEVIMGIPKQAWWVGFLAVLVVCFAYSVSTMLPATLIPIKSRFKAPKEAQ